MAKSFWRRLADSLTIPPIYMPIKGPSDASLAEGWKLAYEAEKERREEVESALSEMLAPVSDHERDELACLLTGYEFSDWAVRLPRSPVKYYSIKDANRLIAAGYRKVR